jgi:hypothetical protein
MVVSDRLTPRESVVAHLVAHPVAHLTEQEGFGDGDTRDNAEHSEEEGERKEGVRRDAYQDTYVERHEDEEKYPQRRAHELAW